MTQTNTNAVEYSEVIQLVGTYTAGRFDIDLLIGPAKAGCRAHIMSVALGRKTPKSQSGITALRDALYGRFGITGDYGRARDRNFRDFCRSHK